MKTQGWVDQELKSPWEVLRMIKNDEMDKIQMIEFIEGPLTGYRALITFNDGKYLRVTPIIGNALRSIEVDIHSSIFKFTERLSEKDFIVIDIGEWYTEYECIHCKIRITIEPEDRLKAEDLHNCEVKNVR